MIQQKSDWITKEEGHQMQKFLKNETINSSPVIAYAYIQTNWTE